MHLASSRESSAAHRPCVPQEQAELLTPRHPRSQRDLARSIARSVWILLAIAAYFNYEIWQMDVKTAFLNGMLSDDVYMIQPEGFVNPKYARNVCKLQRSIYGLKQASRSWNLRFDEVVKGFGFIKNGGESCVYKKVSGSADRKSVV